MTPSAQQPSSMRQASTGSMAPTRSGSSRSRTVAIHFKGVFLVTRSEDPLFGACGNALNGNGGVPRLYLMHDTLTYNASRVPVGATLNAPVLLSFTHDGVHTVATYLNGEPVGRGSGPEYAAVGRFGGGHFAIPFWCGNQYHAGDVAEVIACDRLLPDNQRAGVEQYLAEKYRLRTVRIWE
jgi:hypothetical protein